MTDLEVQLSKRLGKTEQILLNLLSFVEEISETCVCGVSRDHLTSKQSHQDDCPFVQSMDYISSVYGIRVPGKRRDKDGNSIYRKGGN